MEFIEIAKEQYDKFSGRPVAHWNSWIHAYKAFKAFMEEKEQKLGKNDEVKP